MVACWAVGEVDANAQIERVVIDEWKIKADRQFEISLAEAKKKVAHERWLGTGLPRLTFGLTCCQSAGLLVLCAAVPEGGAT